MTWIQQKMQLIRSNPNLTNFSFTSRIKIMAIQSNKGVGKIDEEYQSINPGETGYV